MGILALAATLIVAGVAYQAIASIADADIRSPENAPGKIISVGEFSMHIFCSGARKPGQPTVVLEAGNSEWSTSWARIQADLADDHRVCSYDRQGYAWSEEGSYPITAVASAQNLNLLLARAGESGPYLLAGHSLGMVFIRKYALLYPDDVAGLVIVDGGPPGRMSTFPAELNEVFEQAETAMKMAPALTYLGVTRMLGFVSGSLTGLPEADFAVVEAFGAEPKTIRAFSNENRVMDSLLAETEALTSIGDKPLTVVSADTSYPYSEVMSSLMLNYNRNIATSLSSNGRHVVVSGTDHFDLMADERAASTVADEIRATVMFSSGTD